MRCQDRPWAAVWYSPWLCSLALELAKHTSFQVNESETWDYDLLELMFPRDECLCLRRTATTLYISLNSASLERPCVLILPAVEARGQSSSSPWPMPSATTSSVLRFLPILIHMRSRCKLEKLDSFCTCYLSDVTLRHGVRQCRP